MSFNKTILVIITALFFSSINSVLADNLKIGDKAPNLIGKNIISGKRINLYRLMANMSFKKDKEGNPIIDQDGKYITIFQRNVVVLNFFSRYCIPCKREIPAYNRVAKQYENQAVKMSYVNVDGDVTEAALKKMILKYQIKIPLIQPNQQEVMRTYNTEALPRLVVIGKDKKIVTIITGFRENFENEINQVIANLLEL
jgi:thiol-disulfide isomerase/thioredoxin